jgi:hypothetical protein
VRYRKLDENGDCTFGQGAANFYVDSPEMVRQKIQTRLGLIRGEWFLDKTEGTQWNKIVGKGTNKTYDLVIQTRILQTQGVQSIVQYSSNVDPTTRALTVSCLVQTIYSVNPILVEQQLQ